MSRTFDAARRASPAVSFVPGMVAATKGAPESRCVSRKAAEQLGLLGLATSRVERLPAATQNAANSGLSSRSPLSTSVNVVSTVPPCESRAECAPQPSEAAVPAAHTAKIREAALDIPIHRNVVRTLGHGI